MTCHTQRTTTLLISHGINLHTIHALWFQKLVESNVANASTGSDETKAAMNQLTQQSQEMKEAICKLSQQNSEMKESMLTLMNHNQVLQELIMKHIAKREEFQGDDVI